MNIYDISRKAGVSIATVSRVLNNSPHVSQETKDRVMEVINANGYVPNAFARGLGLNTMKTIGLLCPDASDAYLAKSLDRLESGFRAQGYDCLLFCTGSDLQARSTGIRELLNRHVDGMVLMGSSFIESVDADNAAIREAASSIPVVLLNGFLEGDGLYSVCCDDEAGIREGVKLLASHGRKRILFFNHSTNDSARRKLNGYTAGLEECGLDYDDELVQYIERDKLNIKDGKAFLLELRDRGLVFDSIICSEDVLAVSAMKYAAAASLKVPDELEIIGYDDLEYALCTEPELTSVDSCNAALCSGCVDTMMAVLSGKETPHQTVYTPNVILRGSTL